MAKCRYAEGTAVSVDTSIAEIRRTLVSRYGATSCAVVEDPEAIGVDFVYEGVRVMFCLPIPPLSDKQFASRRWEANDAPRKARRQKEVLRLWRVLLLAVKTKLELVQENALDFKREFMPYMVLPDGLTVADYGIEQIMGVLDRGAGTPALLPRNPERES